MGTRGPGRPQHDDVLTPAEWRVAEQVRHGMTNRRIADRMGVSLDAVKFHVANALAKLGFSTRQQLQQWSGVAKDTALYRSRRLTKMTDASEDSAMVLGQVARTTRHIEESRTWYRDVLGLPELFAFGKLVFFDMGGVRLMLAEEDRNSMSESILYLRVPDIHAAKERLATRGVTFINAPHLIHRHPDGTEEWMAAFQDNEQRPLQLMAQIRPSSS